MSLLVHTPPHLLVDVGTLGTIRLAIPVLTIDRGKVIEFRDGVAPDRLPALPIRP